MSDARFILDLPSQQGGTSEGKKKKPKTEKHSDLTGSGVRSKSQRELDRLLRDQKLYLGPQSDVFHEVRKEVRQSLLEEKRRLAEEEWQRVVEDRQSQRKRRWALYTRVPAGRQIAQIHWAPLPESDMDASEEASLYEPPVSSDLLSAPVSSTAGLTLMDDEWADIAQNCTLPDPWTVADARLLLDAAKAYAHRWYVIADRVMFSFSKQAHGETEKPIGANAVALLFYSIAHYALSRRFRDDPERWHQHPLSVYSMNGEVTEETGVEPVIPFEVEFDKHSSPLKKIPDSNLDVNKSTGRYTHFLADNDPKNCQMHNLHAAVICAKEKDATPTELEVDQLIEKYVKPHLFVASDAVHDKMRELKNRMGSFLKARHRFMNAREKVEK